MEKINLTINNRKVSAEEGSTILEAAKENDIFIPTLCHYLGLEPFASCGVCVVEVEGEGNLLRACSTYIKEGMVITTDNDNVRATRKLCLELLLSEHCGDCVSPCQIACPAGCDVQGYLSHIARGEDEEAIKLIKESIPLPASIGRICPRPCEAECRRNHLEGPVSICSLKRFIGDKDLNNGKAYLPSIEKETGHKVAIIGAGPAGLTAAYFLLGAGHKVTIFEAETKAGGMLQYGIPSYRLPKSVLDKEVQTIIDLGAQVKYGLALGKDMTIDSLKSDGFGAVLLTIGAQNSARMRVEGEDTQGVLWGIEFLKSIASGKRLNVGRNVVVIGGGNTAIDAARTCLRLGAEEVTILYRRTRKEMPAYNVEVEEAQEEGVKIHFLAAPIKLSRDKEKVKLECIRMELGEPDVSGRRRPVPIEGSEFIMFADTVIAAIGQKVDTSYIEDEGIKLTKYGTIDVDPLTYQTNFEGVFAAGDCVTGPDIAAIAIGGAREAAAGIEGYLKGEKAAPKPKPYNSSMGKLDEVPEAFFQNVQKIPRANMPQIPVPDRTGNFKETEVGFSEEVARKEAGRCLECGCKKADDCTLRKLAAEYKVDPERLAGARREYMVDDSHPEIILESNKCILCGICVRFSREIKKIDLLGFVERGFDAKVMLGFDESSSSTKCDFCKELAQVCPTGAIALKTPSLSKLK